jgi:PAS domain S-box-containing protein
MLASEASLPNSALNHANANLVLAMLENTPLVAVQGFGLDGVIRYWNPTSTIQYGITAGQAIGKHMDDVFVSLRGGMNSIQDTIVRVTQDLQPTPPAEVEVITSSDRRLWIFSTIIPLVHEGQVVELYCMDVDITERKQAERELKAKEEFLQSVFSTLPNFMYVYDLEQQAYIFTNSTVGEVLGYTNLDVLSGRVRLNQLVHPTDKSKYNDAVRQLATSDHADTLLAAEYRIRHANQQWLWVLDRMKVLERHADGTPRSIIGSMQDIDQWKNAERDIEKLLVNARNKNRSIEDQNVALAAKNDELAQNQERLKHINAELEEKSQELMQQRAQLEVTLEEMEERNFELDQLVYKVSHDIRSPLTSMLGLINVIKLDPSLAQESLSHMEQSVRRLDEFVKSMLNYAKANRVESQQQEIDFGQLIRQCFSDFTYMDGFETIEKKLDIRGEVETFRGDKLRIDIILRNLVANAIKYYNPRNAPSYINIDIEVKDKVCSITLTDNGIGIRPEFMSKIFEMFFRATENSTGSGLGLYIVKQTVDRLKGHIDISSQFGTGTTVTLRLPSTI